MLRRQHEMSHDHFLPHSFQIFAPLLGAIQVVLATTSIITELDSLLFTCFASPLIFLSLHHFFLISFLNSNFKLCARVFLFPFLLPRQTFVLFILPFLRFNCITISLHFHLETCRWSSNFVKNVLWSQMVACFQGALDATKVQARKATWITTVTKWTQTTRTTRERSDTTWQHQQQASTIHVQLFNCGLFMYTERNDVQAKKSLLICS